MRAFGARPSHPRASRAFGLGLVQGEGLEPERFGSRARSERDLDWGLGLGLGRRNGSRPDTKLRNQPLRQALFAARAPSLSPRPRPSPVPNASGPGLASRRFSRV